MTGGASSIALQRGIAKAVTAVVAELKRQAQPVSTREAIAQVATISANWDAGIGAIIAEATEKVGRDGASTLEENNGLETTLEVVEGVQFEKGYVSPHFVTDAVRNARRRAGRDMELNDAMPKSRSILRLTPSKPMACT